LFAELSRFQHYGSKDQEFLFRCRARVSRMTTRPDDELRRNAEVIERNVRAVKPNESDRRPLGGAIHMMRQAKIE
jgi:hypothetical protein